MVLSEIISAYDELVLALPGSWKIVPPLFFMAATIAFYSIFIWFFYRFLAKKDVLKLDLEKYNVYEHSGLLKFFRVILYIAEFMIIAPIAIFLWFAVLSLFIIILAKEIEVGTVILICAGLISAIRITAYFNEDLSKDLSKMVPFTLLGVAILTPNFINVETSINRISEIPLFFENAFYYLLFIIGLEAFLRVFYIPALLIESKKNKKNSKEQF